MVGKSAAATGLILGLSLVMGGCDAEPMGSRGTGALSGGSGGFMQPGAGGTFGTGGQVNQGGGASGIPCEVEPIIQQKCGNCHGPVPQFGAPMSLVTQADFQTVKPDGGAMHALANTRVGNGTMPPPQQPVLTEAEKATLLGWLAQGAPYSSAVCSTGGTGGIVGTGGMAGTGGTQPPVDADECFEMRAHAAGDVNAPFVKQGLGVDAEEYFNFTFKKPWQGNPEAVTIEHLIGNTAVVHHTLIYQAPGSLPADSVTASLGIHGSNMLLAGWVPGGSDTVLPDNVGLELEQGDFEMEIHYSNHTGAPQEDNTGFRICVTYEGREHKAAVHWLGSEPFAAGSTRWTSTCTPTYKNNEPITVISSWPHMHLNGRHFNTTINRAAGGQETLYDGDFDFYFQATYDTPAVLQPGDTLTTTCDFSAPSSFGTRTTDEMCYNFAIAYPAGAFNSGGGLTSGVNHCML